MGIKAIPPFRKRLTTTNSEEWSGKKSEKYPTDEVAGYSFH